MFVNTSSHDLCRFNIGFYCKAVDCKNHAGPDRYFRISNAINWLILISSVLPHITQVKTIIRTRKVVQTVWCTYPCFEIGEKALFEFERIRIFDY